MDICRSEKKCFATNYATRTQKCVQWIHRRKKKECKSYMFDGKLTPWAHLYDNPQKYGNTLPSSFGKNFDNPATLQFYSVTQVMKGQWHGDIWWWCSRLSVPRHLAWPQFRAWAVCRVTCVSRSGVKCAVFVHTCTGHCQHHVHRCTGNCQHHVHFPHFTHIPIKDNQRPCTDRKLENLKEFKQLLCLNWIHYNVVILTLLLLSL